MMVMMMMTTDLDGEIHLHLHKTEQIDFVYLHFPYWLGMLFIYLH